MGEIEVPAWALWGASTQRAVENFPVSGRPMPSAFVHALGLVKVACAEVNVDLGRLDKATGDAIVQAATEVAEGRLDDHFPVDVFQTGSGTSSNMNANEVIANRAIQLLGGEVGSKQVHPNDDVNLGQSSNDVVPTAIHVALALAVEEALLPALRDLRNALSAKAEAWDDVVTLGRTHLQDATPIRLGQIFAGYASVLDHAVTTLARARVALEELAIGGTAVGTGLNTHPQFGAHVAARLADRTGLSFREADDHRQAQASKAGIVEVSGALRTAAVALMKVADDVRWLASGPRGGLGQLRMPAVQPGSSIMPGKVNPVICESVVQVGAQVQGNDAVVGLGEQWGQFELNTMMPLMADAALESVRLLANAAEVFRSRCIEGLEADEERCRELVERSTAIATALNPVVGYDKAAEVAKRAFAEDKTVREVVLEMGLLSEDEVDEVLDLRAMTEPSED